MITKHSSSIWRVIMAISRAIVSALQFMVIMQTTLSYAHAHDSCEKFGICEHVDDYPTELVRDLIKELKSRNTLFSSDEIDMSLESRFDDEKEELCGFTHKHMIPRRATDAKGTLRFILNDLNNPIQKLNIVTCNEIRSNCNELIGYSANYKGVCIQKMALRELYYVDKNNQTAKTHFRVPVCCSCMLNRLD